MKQGLVWYDPDPKKSLADKIGDATARCVAKFGQVPTAIFTNPLHLDGKVQVNGIAVEASAQMLPNHLWLEVEGNK